ncbi:protein JASON-like isoform X2 [Tripterygium wilfordii]|nr:protein JASON-like isoform X2 [Tripterygium wilfordii]
MICALFKRQLGFVWRSILRFLTRSFFRAMGIFLGCFRDRHTRRRRGGVIASDSASALSNSTETVVSKNRLSSLFLSEEKDYSPGSGRGNFCLESQQIDKELKEEAKFLKACGTLPETPAEIRKASEQLKGSSLCHKGSEPLEFHSWLSNSSIQKLQLDKQLDLPRTPVKLGEELRKDLESLEQTPWSCISNVENTRTSINSIQATETPITNVVKVAADEPDTVQRGNKSVHFQCDIDVSSSKDDMQTPGTVFPANLGNLTDGKPRIRSQYVYSVSNPVENISQWKELKKGNPSSHQLPDELRESIELPEHTTAMSEVTSKETSFDNDVKVDSSLSSWLKPPSNRERHFGRTPGDRPIIGLVAAHWNENEQPQISPKWWDGNGIPNSTNKYKEDQKVRWHATPFEERLEKALSEESFISQRKHVDGRPMVFDDCDENDTAVSQLQRPSTHSKSVVSF